MQLKVLLHPPHCGCHCHCAGEGPDAEHEEGPLPMFTSCCPAWINLVEKSHPELIPNLSTCKSPMGVGSLV